MPRLNEPVCSVTWCGAPPPIRTQLRWGALAAVKAGRRGPPPSPPNAGERSLAGRPSPAGSGRVERDRGCRHAHTELNVTGGASLARDACASAVTEPAPVSSAPSTGVPPANAAGKWLATAPGQNRGRKGTPPTVVRTSLNRRVGEWFAGQDLWQQVTDSVDVNQRVAFYAATGDPADYRISFDLGLGVQLNRWLQWNLSVTDRYLHIPPAGGAVQNDLYIAAGMGVSFGHGAEGAYTGADGRPADR